LRRLVASAALLAGIAGCSGGGATPPAPLATFHLGAGPSTFAPTVVDGIDTAGCSVSYDGLVWYALPAGSFGPLDAGYARCSGPANVRRDPNPLVPAWAHAFAGSQTIFVATSLQDEVLTPGMISLEGTASQSGIPMTWLVQNGAWITSNAALYAQYHAANGDDVETDSDPAVIPLAKAAFSWFAPVVSAEGGEPTRDVPRAVAEGFGGFWGITWNSSGIDGTADRGSPWGTYCADPTSYRRPAPDGSCAFVAFEWTARDLTRAYYSGLEAAFSTDPDDIQLRALFTPAAGAEYEAEMVDAYASAGVTQPLVMMSQQESHEEVDDAPGDPQVLAGLYARVKSDGLQAMTLARAQPLAAQFSARPRAIAFPFLAGGGMPTYHLSEPFTPATIDYHDDVAGMTFSGGHTTPDRVFPYALETTSAYDVPLQKLAQASTPVLRSVAVQNGSLVFAFTAPVATHYGVAIWADPFTLGLVPGSVVFAGHAGFVAAFDLPAGESDRTVPCGSCTAAQFAYST
jgi:hypothetical protein